MNKHYSVGIAYRLVVMGFLVLAWGWAPVRAERAEAVVRYAAPDGLSSGACNNWLVACKLQTALSVAVEGDEIWAKEGLYKPTPGTDRTAAFQLKSGVGIYGGYAGTENAREERNWVTHLTVLSGDIDNNDITEPSGVVTEPARIIGANSYHVVTGSVEGETYLLDGLTITAGFADGSNAAGTGGGLYCWLCSLALSHITFTGNSAANDGGGLYANMAGSVALSDVVFDSNNASYGGGMFAASSSLSMDKVTFTGNLAGTTGGGLYIGYTDAELNQVLFEKNSASFGGGMINWYGNPALKNVAFIENSAFGEAGDGGYGGGLWNNSSSSRLTNVTFSGNTAHYSGGGIYLVDGSSLTVENSIVWGNSQQQIQFGTSSNITLLFSLVQGGCPAGAACTHLLITDPRFVDIPGGDLRLHPGSPAIDAGNNAYITGTTDLAGGPRFVDIPASADTGSGTPPLVDMGAYEANFVDANLEKTVFPLEAAPGQIITYILTFSNGGSLPAVDVLITDIVQSFVTIQKVEFSGVDITNTGHTPPYEWEVQDLAAGQGGTITITALLGVPLAAGIYNNAASISATDDSDASNNLSDTDLHVLNVPPQAQNDGYTTLEDTPLVVPAPGVLANDSDANGDAITAIQDSGAGRGLAALASNGSFTYSPALNLNGPDSFTYHASGGALSSNVATVQLTVTSVNDTPAGTNKTVTTLEDTGYTFTTADFGFTDIHDSPANSFSRAKITTLPAQGTLKLNGGAITPGQFVTAADIINSLLVFSPAPDAYGAPYTNFTFQVEDDGGTAIGGLNLDPTPNVLAINITSVNDAPAGTNKSVTALEDNNYTFATADFGFTDLHDSPANSFSRVKITTLPAQGTMRLNGAALTAGQFVSAANISTGLLVFAPAVDGNGAPYGSFTFQVEDDGGTANGGVNLDLTPNLLTVHITPVNDAPTLDQPGTVTIDEDAAEQMVNLAGIGDGDPELSQSLVITAVSSAPELIPNPIVTYSSPGITGTLRFTPAAEANGDVVLTITVTDNGSGALPNVNAVSIQLTVHVTPVNDAPVAVLDSYEIDQYTTIVVPSPGVLANDHDVEGSPLSAFVDDGPAHGQLVLNLNGSFTYTPAPGYYGLDSFTYHAYDGKLNSNLVTVSLTVHRVYRFFLPLVQGQ